MDNIEKQDSRENDPYFLKLEKSEKEIVRSFDVLKGSEYEFPEAIYRTWTYEEKIMLHEEVVVPNDLLPAAFNNPIMDSPSFRNTFQNYLDAKEGDKSRRLAIAATIANELKEDLSE